MTSSSNPACFFCAAAGADTAILPFACPFIFSGITATSLSRSKFLDLLLGVADRSALLVYSDDTSRRNGVACFWRAIGRSILLIFLKGVTAV